MDKLEAEKRILQEKLDQPVSAPPSPRDISMEIDSPENMMRHIRFLKNEVERLKKNLRTSELQRHGEAGPVHRGGAAHVGGERSAAEEAAEGDGAQGGAVPQLSESESSLEMDDERYFNEMSRTRSFAPRTVSSPIPYTPSPSSSRPISPGLSYASHTVGFTPPATLTRAGMSYYNTPGLHVHVGSSHGIARPSPRRSNSPDKFKRPTPPPSPNTQYGAQPPPPPVQPMVVQSSSSQAAASQNLAHPPAQP
ncbi:hypothetical protein SKAU_G00144850 [Synaphobranchus kaupii]|uniref:Uncharacterized protein n=1 Tax=Synaphobranchus kaupii TaxID=118154 RepID=A0A9Q1FTD5_SYNKA|nr:hypothetical protein SKAU_G00144850 [Synaphobranchus kaupii]